METMMMNGKDVSEPLNCIGDFLEDYAITLLQCGATNIRIERNIKRISESYGVSVDLTILPQHVMVSVKDQHDTNYTTNRQISETVIDFEKNSLLSNLSWIIYDKKIPLTEAKSRLEKIKDKKRLDPILVLILTGLANASFCHIFGGDWISMIIVMIATINGMYIKSKLRKEWDLDIRITTIISAFIATVISSSGYIFQLGNTPDIALGTSVLFLVPGVPFINSICDFIYGHYVCGMCRFIQASIITICLSIGLVLGYLAVNINTL